MGVSDYLRPEHGYAMLVVIYTNLMLVYLMLQVGKYRKKANIKYPAMTSKTDHLFNCYQRAHHNTLEWLPIFYSLFVPSAIVYPVYASILGALFVTSRFLYAWGYYTGDPAKRNWGTWGELAVLLLLFMVGYITLGQFGIV
uniref:microsomal glutathione S-transferase 3-like n=1 Tax=Styela clava TaxID=7725 RepID=UPI0019398984|nr:microsomal glutathione S-transferase 3-like [Styela clava]